MNPFYSSLRAPLMAIALSGLAGCAVPGSHIDSEASDAFATPLANLQVQMVTPELLTTLKAETAPARVNPQLEAAIQNYQYRVGAGDVLNVTVWDHPELTIPAGSYRSAQDAGNWVHSDGTIFYPYIGSVSVAGLTVTEIREIIAAKLSKYIEAPQVDVSVAAFRSQRVYVTGEVANPGQQPITNVPLTLLDAVNAAKGLAEDADWRHVVLTRNGQDNPVSLRALFEKGDLSQNHLLQHNDVIHVPRNDYQKVFVLGEVNQPKPLMIQRAGMSLAEALAEVGGIDEGNADAQGVFVVRANEPDAEHFASVYQIDLSDARSYVFADQFSLQARDLVYVTTQPLGRWNRVLGQLMPTITAIYQTTRSVSDINDL
ncbi:polysaccharide export protein [Ferrimonas balearica]|uniref:polysaccharide export protein n=1 Tax=Ferrimonas balearica TaxID=44012 RepID=UPI001FF0681B|nr:polysaccharide export protein [Ferrimonas balearica]